MDFFSSAFKGGPAQVMQHISDTCISTEIISNELGSLQLHHFNLIDIMSGVG